MLSFHSRLHEPIALAALAAAGSALHVLWIGNLLAARISAVSGGLVLVPALGPISGLYALAAFVYAVVFLVTALIYRHKDCSDARDGAFWFFVSSVVVFAAFTLPSVTTFGFVVGSRI